MGLWPAGCFTSLGEIAKATHDPRNLFNFLPIAEHDDNRKALFANAFSEIAAPGYGAYECI